MCCIWEVCAPHPSNCTIHLEFVFHSCCFYVCMSVVRLVRTVHFVYSFNSCSFYSVCGHGLGMYRQRVTSGMKTICGLFLHEDV